MDYKNAGKLMKKFVWEDITGYSRDVPKNKRTPTLWRYCVGELRIVLHRHIHYRHDEWLLSCEPFFKNHVFTETDVEICKKLALSLVSRKIYEIFLAFQGQELALPGQTEKSLAALSELTKQAQELDM